MVQQEGEDYGYSDFIKTVDTVILGRKTYDWVMSQVAIFPHVDKETFVITRTKRPCIGTINFYNGSLSKLISDLKSNTGGAIFIDGGAEIVNELLKEKLIDEFIISVIPIFLGNGKRLFNETYVEQKLSLISTKQFDKGLVQLHYKIV